ncbi:hypothetical protein I546_0215 [Mycobacterium kansasii 732]|uniref:hypothetical protein n=1 Tax=Mycobacterium pseudokansasii TaxID=2341080 RepID=UPI00044D972C|nr:hypothetical protein [Mycobacterium pseudokansasii]EUA14135.1 hypothetical protein I546_0215 [Mycobacterium kansasii 732]
MLDNELLEAAAGQDKRRSDRSVSAVLAFPRTVPALVDDRPALRTDHPVGYRRLGEPRPRRPGLTEESC